MVRPSRGVLAEFTVSRCFSCLLALSAILVLASIGFLSGYTSTRPQCVRNYPFITLHYGTRRDERVIVHNCMMAQRAKTSMIIHTTMPNSAYCGVCECRLFKPSKCPAPRRHKNLCEKLQFVARAVPRLGAFFYVDSDLIVVREAFFHALQLRAQAHDWLAAYGHRGRREKPRYKNRFNSGLFFMRALPGVNYSELMPMMYAYDTGNDQSVLSDFVFRYYTNWDSLSVRFNCRGILRFKDDVPPEHCLGIHDRSESDVLRRKLNLSLMHLGV